MPLISVENVLTIKSCHTNIFSASISINIKNIKVLTLEVVLARSQEYGPVGNGSCSDIRTRPTRWLEDLRAENSSYTVTVYVNTLEECSGNVE